MSVWWRERERACVAVNASEAKKKVSSKLSI